MLSSSTPSALGRTGSPKKYFLRKSFASGVLATVMKTLTHTGSTRGINTGCRRLATFDRRRQGHGNTERGVLSLLLFSLLKTRKF